ncbi:hypothetical protein P8452_41339 [Trifolium repens]|nr:hypothetical protein P8452_41339 [Trifolium repens]
MILLILDQHTLRIETPNYSLDPIHATPPFPNSHHFTVLLLLVVLLVLLAKPLQNLHFQSSSTLHSQAVTLLADLVRFLILQLLWWK